MYGVFEPFRKPIGNKRDVGNKARNCGIAASSTGGARLTVTGRRVLDVDGGECDGKPSRVNGPDEPSEETDHIDVAVVVGDIDRSLQHEGAERYAADPGDECDNHDDDEDQKDDATGVVLSIQHIDGCSQAPKDIQYSGEPNDLLRKHANQQNIDEAEHHGETEADEKEDNRVVVEGERLA